MIEKCFAAPQLRAGAAANGAAPDKNGAVPNENGAVKK